MTEHKTIIEQAYAAFNQRDLDRALALMSEGVSWPKASEGGRAIGKEEIRSYWTRQWSEFDPHVEPTEISDQGAGRITVRVRQVVKNLEGVVLSDTEVLHSYILKDGLIQRMDLEQSTEVATAAFSH